MVSGHIARNQTCFENNSIFNVSIEFGSHIFKGSDISLFPIIEMERQGAKYNCAVLLNVDNRKYMIAQIYFSEMFTKTPVFSMLNNELLWDGGLNYIGNRKTDWLYSYLIRKA